MEKSQRKLTKTVPLFQEKSEDILLSKKVVTSEKTLYNYIDAGFFDARNIDLPRKVRYRPRRKKKEFKVDRGCYIGRSYEEYQKLLNKKTDIHPAQMDSVIGTVGGKVLLTIHFPHTSFMIGFLRDFNTSQSVIDIFEMLYVKLGYKQVEKNQVIINPKLLKR